MLLPLISLPYCNDNHMYVIMENVCVFQDDEDSISELMVDRDKKPRFKLEKVGQVMI